MNQVDLTSWGMFSELSEVQVVGFVGDSAAALANASLSRFNARYRAAKSMTITFEYIGEVTGQGYADILGVGFAYSALEALLNGIERSDAAREAEIVPKFPSIMVDAPRVAELFRASECERLRKALQKHLNPKRSKSVKDDLNALEMQGADVLPLAKGIRHLAFHGVFAPGTVGYGNSGKGSVVQKLLQELRLEILRASDEHFTAWVKLRTT